MEHWQQFYFMVFHGELFETVKPKSGNSAKETAEPLVCDCGSIFDTFPVANFNK